MTARDQILSDIQSALEDLPTKTAYPEYDEKDFIRRGAEDLESPEKSFQREFEKVHGTVCESPEDLKRLLQSEGVQSICCDPDLRELVAPLGFEVNELFERSNPDACQAGISKGSGVIAESGTLILKDEDTFDRLAALGPWVHVAVVSRKTIYRTIPDAIEALGTDPNVIWCTGPSKTADVEGILIEGVHGPGVQVVYFVD